MLIWSVPQWVLCVAFNCMTCVSVYVHLYTALGSVLYEALTITPVTLVSMDKKSLRPIGRALSAIRKFSGRRAMRLVLEEDGYTGWPNLLSIILIPPPCRERDLWLGFFVALWNRWIQKVDTDYNINTVWHLFQRRLIFNWAGGGEKMGGCEWMMCH